MAVSFDEEDFVALNFDNIDFEQIVKIESESNLFLLIENIDKILNIKYLSINCNLTHLPQEITKLKNLVLLDLSGNAFTSFPTQITELSSLIYLNLSIQSLQNVPESIAQDLPNLELLGFTNNSLSFKNGEIDFSTRIALNNYNFSLNELYKFTQIQKLDLSGCQSPILLEINFTKFKSLKALGMTNCSLEILPQNVFQLVNLEELDVSINRITEIPIGITQLSSLKRLYIRRNAIQYIPEEVSSLSLSSEVKQSLSYNGDMHSLSIGLNPIENVPEEIYNAGFGAIKSYFEAIKEGKKEKMLAAKLMFVGRGRVGKTTLLKKLTQSAYDIEGQYQEDTTRGVNISNWEFLTEEQNKFETRIWDFGGQEHYIVPHQFFLTKRSVYLLVWDAMQEEDDTTFYHWLNLIKILSDKSPVILVMNKADLRMKAIDEAGLKERFPNIVNFHKISCKDGTGLDVLREDIKKTLASLIHTKDELPITWKQLRNGLEKKGSLGTNIISQKEYYDKCSSYKLDKEQAKVLNAFLHDLGTIIHFPTNPQLMNTVILNPEWLTKAIYAIIDDNEIIGNEGKFSFEDLDRIWTEKGYESDVYGILLELMLMFKICFKHQESGSYIIPLLLSPSKPLVLQNEPFTLSIVYKYGFMPAGIITRLIVQHYDKIADNTIYWRNGVIFTKENVQILVEEERHTQRLLISVKGGQNRLAHLAWIRYEIEAIHNKDFSSIEVEIHLPCPCTLCKTSSKPHFYTYAKLTKKIERGKTTIECEESDEDVNISRLLGNVGLDIAASERGLDNMYSEERSTKKRIFLSYSHEDEEYKEKLDIHLAALKRNEKIETWNYRKIMPGDNQANNISNAIENADIILLLLSANFIANDAIWKKEIAAAYQRQQLGLARIIPIYLRPCDTESLDFMQLQGTPRDKKWITSQWEDEDEAFLEVVETLKKVLY